MYTLSPAELTTLLVAVSVVSVVISYLVFLVKHPNATPAQLDEAATIRLEGISHDPNAIEVARLSFQHASDANKLFAETVLNILRIIAPLTPIKADDAAAALLDAITAPDSPPAAPVAVSETRFSALSADSAAIATQRLEELFRNNADALG